jgi:hypothetical protein
MSRKARRSNGLFDERIAQAMVELKRGPLTAYKLSLVTGWPIWIARKVLELMLTDGLLVEAGRELRGAGQKTGATGRIYALTASAEEKRQRAAKPAPYKGIPAGRITIPQFRWGSTRQW